MGNMNMNLDEAIKAALEGNFVSNSSFGAEQSMHGYKGDLFYEDGPNLTRMNFIEKLEEYGWAQSGWYIKYTPDKIDNEKLAALHNRPLPLTASYEAAIKQ